MSRSVRALAWAGVVLLGVLASLRALRDPLAAPLPTAANSSLTAGQDFRDATYYPLRELLAGGDPYLPQNMFDRWPVRQEFALYAPSHLLTQLPYAAADYRTGLVLFSLVSIACLLAIGVVSARACRLPGGWLSAWLVGGLVVLSQPGKSALFFGQINPLVGLGGVLALTQARRRPVWAAVGLALAWTKPQFGIPLLVLLLARGAWREGLGGSVLAGVVSLPVVGVLVAREGLLGFVDVVRANLEYSASVDYTAVDSMSGARVDGAAVLYRLTGWLPPLAEGVVLVVVLGLAALLLARRGRGSPLGAGDLLLASTATLVCIVHQQSESLIATPGIVAVAALLVRRRPVAPAVVVAAVLVLLPAGHAAFVETLLQDQVSPWFDSIWEGVVLNLAFWVLVVHRVALEVRVARRPHDVAPAPPRIVR